MTVRGKAATARQVQFRFFIQNILRTGKCITIHNENEFNLHVNKNLFSLKVWFEKEAFGEPEMVYKHYYKIILNIVPCMNRIY